MSLRANQIAGINSRKGAPRSRKAAADRGQLWPIATALSPGSASIISREATPSRRPHTNQTEMYSLARLFARLRVATPVAVLLLALSAPVAAAQAPARPPVPARRALFGDLAIELRSPSVGALAIGAADERNALTLDVRASDARRWADSAARILARPRTQRRRVSPRAAKARGKGTPDESVDVVRRWRAVLEEPGVGQGSFVLVRVDSAGVSSWLLYAADADLTEMRQTLELSEARTLVSIVRRTAVAALPPPAPRKRKRLPVPRPAADSGRSAAPRKPA